MADTFRKTIHLATLFKALGDPSRLRIFEFLCSASSQPIAVGESGEVRIVDGLTVGEVCCRITGEEKVTSTISQQLKQLRQAGLINVERRGKNMICSVDRDALEMLKNILGEWQSVAQSADCCSEPTR